MANMIFRRPRIDTRSTYFAQVYKMERACLQHQAAFLKQAAGSQVAFMRQFFTIHENTVVEGHWAPVIAKVPVVLFRPTSTPADLSASSSGHSHGHGHGGAFARNSSGGSLSGSFNGARASLAGGPAAGGQSSGGHPTIFHSDASVFVLEVHPSIGMLAQFPEIMTNALCDAARLLGPK